MKILCVDDELRYLDKTSEILSKYGKVFQVRTKEKALESIKKKQLDAAFIDLTLYGKLEGINILKVASKQNIKCVILTNNNDERVVRECIDNGCHRFYTKNDFYSNHKSILKELLSEDVNLKENLKLFFRTKYITKDQDLKDDIENIVKRDLTRNRVIMILGPTGVGKTHLAKYISHLLDGDQKPFEEFSPQNISKNLADSELFGHIKGSFTGAVTSKKGRIELADNGTLFIDEIGDMTPEVQAKLLKTLESKMFRKVGSEEDQYSDFRLIVAGNNLLQKVRDGDFREDLFQRLNDVIINIKPLRDRVSDIPPLIRRFTEDYSSMYSKGKVAYSDEALQALLDYKWPGNIRELQKTIEKLVFNTDRNFINEKSVKDLLFFEENNAAFKYIEPRQLSFILKYGYREFLKRIEGELSEYIYESEAESLKDSHHKIQVSNTAFKRMLSYSKKYGGTDAKY
jgi:DNA-binding NtrC family response regulator